MKALEDDHGKLALYSLPDGKLVQVAQYWCDVVKLFGAGHNARCLILYFMELLQQTVANENLYFTTNVIARMQDII